MTDPGYATVNGVAVHVSTLRRHTADLRRFLRLLPFTERLNGLTPHTPEWHEAVTRALTDSGATAYDLALTFRESGELARAMADELTDDRDGAA